MKYLKILTLLFFLANITSCATSNVQTLDPVETLLKTTKRSFVKIEVSVWSLNCVDTKAGKKECTKEKIGGAWGSGSVVKYKGKKHILTVAHICESERMNAMAHITQQKLVYDFAATVEANSWNSYSAIPIKINHRNDICLMAVDSIEAPYLRISNKKPSSSSLCCNNKRYVRFTLTMLQKPKHFLEQGKPNNHEPFIVIFISSKHSLPWHRLFRSTPRTLQIKLFSSNGLTFQFLL